MFLIADQTVQEAFLRGARPADIAAMLVILRKYPLDAVDVTLASWQRMPLAMPTPLRDLLRCETGTCEKKIQKAADYGFQRVLIAWEHQANGNSEPLNNAVRAAAVRHLRVSIGIEAREHATNEFECYNDLMAECVVERLVYRDSSGKRDPLRTFRDLNGMQAPEFAPIEYHGHNFYGLATGNSLGALRAGTRYIATSVGGIGNHAAMEEVLMIVTELWKQGPKPAWPTLAADCGRILSGMGTDIPRNKAIIGPAIFEHESGIHVDGVAKNPSLYEAFRPETVGLARRTIIGKHSGTASLRRKFQEWGITLSREKATNLLERVREISIKQKGPLSEEQLRKLVF